MTSGLRLAVWRPGHSGLHNFVTNCPYQHNGKCYCPRYSRATFTGPVAQRGRFNRGRPERQSQETIPGKSLTFSVLPPCYCCSDFKNRKKLSHLKAKASQEG